VTRWRRSRTRFLTDLRSDWPSVNRCWSVTGTAGGRSSCLSPPRTARVGYRRGTCPRRRAQRWFRRRTTRPSYQLRSATCSTSSSKISKAAGCGAALAMGERDGYQRRRWRSLADRAAGGRCRMPIVYRDRASPARWSNPAGGPVVPIGLDPRRTIMPNAALPTLTGFRHCARHSSPRSSCTAPASACRASCRNRWASGRCGRYHGRPWCLPG